MNLLVRIASLLALLVLPLLACQPGPETWRGLALPSADPPAATNGRGDPLTARTLRLGLTNGKRQVLFSDEGSPVEATPGMTLDMRFVANTPFSSVDVLGAAWGGDDARVSLRLADSTGAIVAETTVGPFLDRTWLTLGLSTRAPGTYRLELRRAGADPVGWWSARFGESTPRTISGPPPFVVGAIPEYPGGEVTIPVNARAGRLAFLGGRSSYDHGIGWWRDFEVQADRGDRQFIGDVAGWVAVDYTDGQSDRIPLAFGFTLWWSSHHRSDRWGGPFPEPFASSPGVTAALERTLRLRPIGGGHDLTPDAWEYQPRPEVIRQIRLIDNPEIQGFPIIGAVSLLTRDRGATMTSLGGSARADQAIRPDDLAGDRWQDAVTPLRNLVYRRIQEIPDRPMLPAPTTPDLAIEGGRGDLLTGMWRANLADLQAKFPADGRFRTSSPGAPNYGGYQGIGAWREGVGFFSGQVWARDLGRSAIELSRFGDSDRVEESLRFAGDRLYDLPNAYPRIARRGQPLPPRWTTVLGEPLYLDSDREGDGNWENDSQGLLILAYARTWLTRSSDREWLARHVGTVRDAANWFFEQLERPDRWKSQNGLLYGEGEAANDGGFDVLSNTLAWRALIAAAEMVDAVGETDRAERYRSTAEQVRAAVNRDLIEPDPGGTAWQSVAWNWGYGHEALAPVFTAPDSGDYRLASLTAEERVIAEATYRRQLLRCANLACVRAIGFGQGFLAQTALLLDDLATAGILLDRLATVSYDARLSPYLVPEGVAMDPEGRFWYRTGDLGNAIHQAEVMKAFALIAGVESNGPGRLRVLPRPADDWRSVTVTGWRTPDGPVDYQLRRESSGLQLQITLPTRASVRFGPLPPTGQIMVNGTSIAGPVTLVGGRRWIWIEDLSAGSHRIESQP